MQENADEIETAKRWVEQAYENYPEGVKGFGKRSFWPTPTIILEEPLDVDILEEVIVEHGFDTKRKQGTGGNSLVAACITDQDGETNIIYTFSDTDEVNLDSPKRYDEMPENGRGALIIDYLNRVYGE